MATSIELYDILTCPLKDYNLSLQDFMNVQRASKSTYVALQERMHLILNTMAQKADPESRPIVIYTLLHDAPISNEAFNTFVQLDYATYVTPENVFRACLQTDRLVTSPCLHDRFLTYVLQPLLVLQSPKEILTTLIQFVKYTKPYAEQTQQQLKDSLFQLSMNVLVCVMDVYKNDAKMHMLQSKKRLCLMYRKLFRAFNPLIQCYVQDHPDMSSDLRVLSKVASNGCVDFIERIS